MLRAHESTESLMLRKSAKGTAWERTTGCCDVIADIAGTSEGAAVRARANGSFGEAGRNGAVDGTSLDRIGGTSGMDSIWWRFDSGFSIDQKDHTV